jgi:signal transduction histidine kinase
MTGHFLLDGSLLTVSLFNSILMLWLGLTVLLNAGHRSPAGRSGSWGYWTAAGSLMLGGAFFAFHSILLGLSLSAVVPALQFWWRSGWITVVVLPFTWYVVMLWYAGFWEAGASGLFRRHRAWFLFCAASALAWIFLALTANPVPSFSGLLQYGANPAPSAGGLPGVMLAYPVFIVLCNALAFDALRRPGPTARLMGAAARLRARPWLTAASAALLVMCLLVGFAELWILLNIQSRPADEFLTILGELDLIISALIGAATLLLGQAIVAYEVFTGRILPRRGLARYWRNAVLLAAGYSLVTGWSLAGRLMPVYILLLATVMMTVFYALLARRSYTERDSFLEILRPFVTSQGLYERLIVDDAAPWEADSAEPFRALCAGFLGCECAALSATGPMAPLWGPPLAFPKDFSVALPLPKPPEPTAKSAASLEFNRSDRLRWALTLWSRRGPVGILLLGDKRDGSLYTQEDFDIAQAVCERLIDAQTGSELMRRLISIQKERLTGSRVLDHKTRRVLHDEILPSLHAVLLSLNAEPAAPPDSSTAVSALKDVHRRISQLLIDMPRAPVSDEPVRNVADSLRRLIADELQGAFDEVEWRIDPQAERAAQELPPMFLEVWFYAAREAVRNAAKHGRAQDATRPLHLAVALLGGEDLEIAIDDDGIGFPPSGGRGSGTGQGLELHGTLMAVIGGRLAVEKSARGGALVRLILPYSGYRRPEDNPAGGKIAV